MAPKYLSSSIQASKRSHFTHAYSLFKLTLSALEQLSFTPAKVNFVLVCLTVGDVLHVARSSLSQPWDGASTP